MNRRTAVFCAFFALSLAAGELAAQQPSPVTAIKAGRLIDPESGTVSSNQIILVEGEKITAVGPNLAIPTGATGH